MQALRYEMPLAICFNAGMQAKDPNVLALIALCDREGGIEFVAAAAGVSAENLKQIYKGVLLPSGKPRGVGPNLRASLTKAFPNWLSRIGPAVSEPLAPYTIAPKGSAFDVLTEDEAAMLQDYRAMMDDDRTELRAEIGKRAARIRAHLEKLQHQHGLPSLVASSTTAPTRPVGK